MYQRAIEVFSQRIKELEVYRDISKNSTAKCQVFKIEFNEKTLKLNEILMGMVLNARGLQ